MSIQALSHSTSVKQQCVHLVKKTHYALERIIHIALRFFLLTLPLHKIPLIRQLGERKILADEKIHITAHLNLLTTAGRAVADFSVCPRPSFKLNPLDAKQIAKAKELQYSSANVAELLHLLKDPWSTQQDFGRRDWEAYDAVNFELIKEYFHNLATVFSYGQFEREQELLAKWDVDLSEAMVAEALAKSLAYSEGHEGKMISLPVKNSDGTVTFICYSIEEIRFGKELPGYLLKPITDTSASPWLIARGTQSMLKKDPKGRELRKGARESIKADFNPESITHKVVGEALKRPNLKSLFEDSPFCHINLAGHSLGGVLVKDLATRYPDKVQKVYAFSPPALGPIEARRWEAQLDKKVISIHVSGDLIPCAGYHVKGLHLEVALKEKGHPITAHNMMALNKPFKIARIDNREESARKSRQRLAIIQKLQKRLMDFFQVV